MLVMEKTKIRNLELNNRIIRAALWMKMADKDGHITPQLYKVYEELSKGGVGMIITGYSMVDPNDRPNPGMMGIYNDSFIEEHRKLVDTVHSNGTPIAIQLAYGGSQNYHPDFQDATLFGPSAVKNRLTGITPKEMSKEDIQHLTKMFTSAAIRAQKSGYDAVEIHGAHGYLLSQFLTPFCNRRTDEYGGTIENRSRIIVDVIQSIRKAAGDNFTIMVKMNHDDYMDEGEGLTLADAVEVAKILEKAGADLLEISGVNETSGKGVGPARTKINKPELQSYFLEPTKQIAEAVTIPVLLMGGNRDFKRMQGILNDTSIAYFSIARPLLYEPDLVNKWKDNPDYKPLCISCNACYREGEVGCSVKEKRSITKV
ncbi:NADH:flavin oxidoreductase [Labilibaculum antarcticum]|uniref:NADH:flavin oxidoreductase n=1 Tax=Labilibaculum antarcticum TaxID=1717717 RepID=A0A1Y1CM93_9BACT|nr:NADH:flavin oxidoreductase [Labilibaculum antarcticum]BAX81072.1 NADH:flavin oxidoreductase [Labilibaculum antarcticum]